MSAKHTPEPWNAAGTLVREHAHLFVVAQCSGGTQKAVEVGTTNAARIVACVNALAGISTAALEKIARLDDAHRFGALADLAKLHHLKHTGDEW